MYLEKYLGQNIGKDNFSSNTSTENFSIDFVLRQRFAQIDWCRNIRKSDCWKRCLTANSLEVAICSSEKLSKSVKKTTTLKSFFSKFANLESANSQTKDLTTTTFQRILQNFAEKAIFLRTTLDGYFCPSKLLTEMPLIKWITLCTSKLRSTRSVIVLFSCVAGSTIRCSSNNLSAEKSVTSCNSITLSPSSRSSLSIPSNDRTYTASLK